MKARPGSIVDSSREVLMDPWESKRIEDSLKMKDKPKNQKSAKVIQLWPPRGSSQRRSRG